MTGDAAETSNIRRSGLRKSPIIILPRRHPLTILPPMPFLKSFLFIQSAPAPSRFVAWAGGWIVKFQGPV
ncbi:hypothetical protein IFT82_10280 [Sphingomonas sp. CFBP 8760]|nr:hypothetical protein [Sphingomonas sp. CFBP 8760]